LSRIGGCFRGENLDFLNEESYEYIIATKRRWNKEIEKLMLTRIEARGKVFAREVKQGGTGATSSTSTRIPSGRSVSSSGNLDNPSNKS